MTLPTEPIGSVPRPQALIDGMQAAAAGRISAEQLEALYDDAVRDTLSRFEETGSPVITDGEQRKPSFATYPVAGLRLASGGVTIPFEDGHTRQLPVLTEAPFRYSTKAYEYLDGARGKPTVPLKQAVIAASAIGLMYPGDGIDGYPREAFLDDLVSEAASEIRGCLERGASVQIDFTEGRLVPQARSVGRPAQLVRRPQQPGPRRARPTRSGRASASILAQAATRIRRTAPTSTTPACCRRYSD